MKDEEMAEEYAEKHSFRVPYDGSNKFYDDTDFKASKDGFLAGLKVGKLQWHDLQKNKNDLPKEPTEKMKIRLDNLTLNVVCEKSKEGKEYLFTDTKGKTFMSIINSKVVGNRLVIDLEPFREKDYKVYAFNR